jgi:hypothetical protein
MRSKIPLLVEKGKAKESTSFTRKIQLWVWASLPGTDLFAAYSSRCWEILGYLPPIADVSQGFF